MFIAISLPDNFDFVFDLLLHSLYCIVTVSDLAYTFTVISRPLQRPLTSPPGSTISPLKFLATLFHFIFQQSLLFSSQATTELISILSPETFGEPLVVTGKMIFFPITVAFHTLQSPCWNFQPYRVYVLANRITCFLKCSHIFYFCLWSWKFLLLEIFPFNLSSTLSTYKHIFFIL